MVELVCWDQSDYICQYNALEVRCEDSSAVVSNVSLSNAISEVGGSHRVRVPAELDRRAAQPSLITTFTRPVLT